MGVPSSIWGFVTIITLGLYEAWHKFRKTNPWRPKLSTKEVLYLQTQADLAAYQEAFEARTLSLIARMRFLVAMGIQPVISFCNDKSAGKSTAAMYFASLIAEYCRKTVVILPASSNTSTGTLKKMSGIQGNMIDVVELARDIKKFGAYRALSERLPRTHHGVGVVVESRHNVVNGDSPYTIESFYDLIRTIYPNVDVIILDHGNDNIDRTSIALAATRMSTALVFTANYRTPISKETMQRTIAGYHTDTKPRSDEELGVEPLPGERIPTPRKVANSVVIAAATRSGDVVDFVELTRPDTHNANASSVPAWCGQGVSVQYDSYIGNEDPQPADLAAIAPETLQGYLEGTVAALEASAQNLGVVIPDDAPQIVQLPQLTSEGLS